MGAPGARRRWPSCARCSSGNAPVPTRRRPPWPTSAGSLRNNAGLPMAPSSRRIDCGAAGRSRGGPGRGAQGYRRADERGVLRAGPIPDPAFLPFAAPGSARPGASRYVLAGLPAKRLLVRPPRQGTEAALNRNLHLCCGSEHASEAEVGDLASEAVGLGLGGSAVDMVWAKVLVEGAVEQHAVDRDGIEAATAQMAFLGPRRWRRRWNCARK